MGNGFSFTDDFRRILQGAREEAARLRHPYIGTEHLLLGLLRVPEGPAMVALTALGVDVQDLRAEVESTVKPGQAKSPSLAELPYTARATKVLEESMEEARELQDSSVGSEHLLLGLLREGRGIAALVLANSGLPLDVIRPIVMQHRSTQTTPAEAPAPPSCVTILAEYQGGRIQARRFARVEDAAAHLAQWLPRS